MNRTPNPNQFEDIVHGYFNICNRSITMMENINNRVSNILDTYCENVHQHAMNYNLNTPPTDTRRTRRREQRTTYRPMTSIFEPSSIRQNPFARTSFSNTFNNLYRNNINNPRVRINTRTSSNNSARNFSSQTLPNLTNFINNTLNTATWSHSIPSISDISSSTISGTWGLHPFGISRNTSINTDCPIAQRPFNNGESVLMIQHCNHCFVRDSLLRWFQLDSRCPVCRWDIYNASHNDTSGNSLPLRPVVPPPPPPITSSNPPPPPPPTQSNLSNLSNIFRDDVLNNNNTTSETSLPTIPGVDRTTHNFLRNVTNTIESGLSNVLRNRGIDLSSNIVEASYTFSLPTPPSRNNIFNEETYHIRQQISPITNTDNSNNIVSNDEDEDYH